MQLTPEDHAKLETKQLANIIRKLNSGKTLTAREEAILARARATPAAGVQTPVQAPLASAFAENFEELATALGVSRKSLGNWRARADLVGKFPKARADGRHDVAAWARFMVEHQLARADELVDADGWEGEGEELRTVRDWKMRREQLACTKLEREIDREDGKLLVATEHEIAMGQLLAGVMAGLNHLPGSAARNLVGLRDIHAIQARLEDEVTIISQGLHAARYLEEDILAAVVTALPSDPEAQELLKAVSFAGQDHASLLMLIRIGAREALRAIGRRALSPAPAPPSSAHDIPPSSKEAAEGPPSTGGVPPPSGEKGPSPGKTARPKRRPSAGGKRKQRASMHPAPQAVSSSNPKSTRRRKARVVSPSNP